MTPRVVVVGSMHMDFVVVLNRFPEIGETVIGKDFKMTPGGKGANQAVSAARLGAETYLVSRVGNDSIGVHLLENLRSNSVRDRYVTIDTESYTGVALIFVDSKGRNMIAVAPGTDARVSREDVDRAFNELCSMDTVLLQLEIPVDTVVYAAKKGKEIGSLIILNPAPYRKLPEEIFLNVDVITPNRIEAEQLTGIKIDSLSDCEKAGKALLGKGVKIAVITLGERGAYVVSNEYTGLVESFQVPVVDTTGAGDAFNGALAVALAEGMPIKEAVIFANATSSLKITRLGAQEGLPRRREIENFLSTRGIKLRSKRQ